MAFDLLAGYNKVKNVCFWGAHVGDEGLLALADLLQVRSCSSPKPPPDPITCARMRRHAQCR